MEKWCDNLKSNIGKVDIIGYFKFIRFLAKMYEDKSLSEEDIIKQCQRFEDVMAVRYLYKGVTIEKIRVSRKEIIDIIRSTIKHQKDLKRLSTLVREEFDIGRLVETGEVSRESLTRRTHINIERGMVINIRPDTVLMNSLAKYYLILREFEFSPEATINFLHVLRDNYVPIALENYLKDKVGYSFKFNDDCWGLTTGSTISVVFFYVPTHPLNPVIMFPVYGTGKGVLLNLFNREEDFGEYTRLIEILYGTEIENVSPDKQINFRASRSFLNTNTADIDSILNGLMREGMQKDYMNSDIVLQRGGELGMNLIFNQMLNVLKGEDTLDNSVFNNYESKYLYRNSYMYIVNSMVHEDVKKALSSYCQNQLRRLYYICNSYLEEQQGIYLRDISALLGTFNFSNMWTVDDTLVDIYDLNAIAHWIVFKYLKTEFMPIDISTSDIRRIMVVLNTLIYSPKLYYELVKHNLGYQRVEVEGTTLEGNYSIVMESDIDTMVINSINIGARFPIYNEVKVKVNKRLSNRENEMIKRVIPGMISNAIHDNTDNMNLLLDDYDDIVLMNPLTAGVYFFNVQREELNDKYYKHPEKLEIISREGNKVQIALSGKTFEFELDKDKKVQLLESTGEGFNLNSSSLGFKSNLFDGDY